MSPGALAGFLLWRKWMFDIDNRAAQETGYLFEPIIAAAIGGTPAPSRKSPVKRFRDSSKGRQVDCIKGNRAYEFKIRVTIAASGQGRWGEEIEFPADCRASGFVPVLVVLDPTANPKLSELIRAFEANDGEVYIGAQAWQHLELAAGPTLGRFLNSYVHEPIARVLEQLPPPGEIPELVMNMSQHLVAIKVDGHEFTVRRRPPIGSDLIDSDDEMPDDADENLSGP